ncbi:hypothetical protein [Sporomusa sp.]|uniref:hypothetical protein n=1 Tax=Sporomusa sp. TaxID=2078658 RepID=UPI002D0B66EA|nr:hypothetical protein [Sporomusa sp.]HWR09064.1 hypothetical protein [Sporomusa sp.]
MMAVVKLPQTSTIAIKLQKGLTTSGSPAVCHPELHRQTVGGRPGFVRCGSYIWSYVRKSFIQRIQEVLQI